MEQTIRINPLPAPTWNHMEINDAEFAWPAAGKGFAAESPIATGAGKEADQIFAGAETTDLRSEAGEEAEREITFAVPEGAKETAVYTLTAEEGSRLTVYARIRGGKGSLGAVRLLIHLRKNAALRLVELIEPGEEGRILHDIGGICGEGASAALLHLYLGRGDLASGCRMDLAGEKSRFDFEAGYLEQKRQKLDVNLIANHIGPGTVCNLRADGTLKDEAEKIFRGSIDFKRGSKGSVGAEQENVLLLGEGVVNKTVPLILCAEEDVQGDHGATIGELDEDTLFYFASRGIGPEEAENLLTREKLLRLSAAMGREDMENAARLAIEEVL